MSKWAVQAVLYGLYCLLYMCLHISFQGDVDASFPCLFATAFIDEFAVAADGESVIRFQCVTVIFQNTVVEKDFFLPKQDNSLASG